MAKFSKELSKIFQKMPCIVCESQVGIYPDHIKCRNTRPDLINDPRNLWPLCNEHHREKEKGLSKFVRYHQLEDELRRRGMEYCEYLDKWFFPENL